MWLGFTAARWSMFGSKLFATVEYDLVDEFDKLFWSVGWFLLADNIRCSLSKLVVGWICIDSGRGKMSSAVYCRAPWSCLPCWIELYMEPVICVGKIVTTDSDRLCIDRPSLRWWSVVGMLVLANESLLWWATLSCEPLLTDCMDTRLHAPCAPFPTLASSVTSWVESYRPPSPNPVPSSTCADIWCKTGTIGMRLLALCECGIDSRGRCVDAGFTSSLFSLFFSFFSGS